MTPQCNFNEECNENAITNIPHLQKSLCKKHYIQNLEERTKENIEENKLIDYEDPNEKVLICLSGGKDSQVLLNIFAKKSSKKVKMEAVFIDLSITPHNYSKESYNQIKQLIENYNIPLNVVKIDNEIGFNIDDVHVIGKKMRSRGRKKGNRYRGECSYCGLIKRYYINKYAYDNGFTKVATGHNLTDEATSLFANFLSMDFDLLERLGPKTITNVEKLITRIKPMYYLYEHEIVTYAFYENINHVSVQCEYAHDSPMLKLKESLLKMENSRPGTMINMVRKYQHKLKNIILESQNATRAAQNYGQELFFCSECGMPSTVERCSFCKLIERLKEQIEYYKI